ncbi:MAG: D-alanyl-D-alanine carboxypeptidase, partial [Burkholderiaceae bacterium]|nr:D-alanyl-D-alanine carboxypeptidase [Burkholderiaceae bacterium]
PYVAEYISSLPISGIDGTMKKRKVATGYAHVKTGYIENVRSIAGYIKGTSGRYYAVSAIINSVHAIDSMPVMDAVITWIYKHG